MLLPTGSQRGDRYRCIRVSLFSSSLRCILSFSVLSPELNMAVSILLRFSVGLLATVGVVANPILKARAVIAHDAVVGFAEAVPSGAVGNVYEAYQPFLYVVNGCVPFPAVNSAGNTGYVSHPPILNNAKFRSGGLATSGSSNGQCSSSPGQIYVRGTASNGRYAVMYSWCVSSPPPQPTSYMRNRYFPKDSPSSGLGHRHDWEGVIVWLSSATATTAANVLAVCPSAHGGWDCNTSFSLSGTGPLIKYESIWPVNHATDFTTTKGGQQPLIAWESLTAAARTALENTDFGDAIVPFKDGTFAGNLAAATF